MISIIQSPLLPQLVEVMAQLSERTKGKQFNEKSIGRVANVADKASAILSAIGKFDPASTAKIYKTAAQMIVLHDEAMKEKQTPFHAIMKIADSAVKIDEEMGDIKIPDQAMKLLSSHGQILGVNMNGPKEVVVKQASATLHMTLNVSMDSFQLAKGLAKGANGGSYFEFAKSETNPKGQGIINRIR
jgi:hypothetical protein